jgi:hypothetical protein
MYLWRKLGQSWEDYFLQNFTTIKTNYDLLYDTYCAMFCKTHARVDYELFQSKEVARRRSSQYSTYRWRVERPHRGERGSLDRRERACMRTNQKAVTCQQQDSWSVYGKRHRRSGGPCPGQDLHRHRAWNYSLSVSNEHSAWNHQHDHMIHLNCPNWSKPFSLREDVYKQRKAMSKRKLLFCSPACAGKSRRAPPRAAECAFCAKRVLIYESLIKRRE